MKQGGWACPDDVEIMGAIRRATERLHALYPGWKVETTSTATFKARGYSMPEFGVGIIVVSLAGGAAHAYRVMWNVETLSGRLVKIGSM